MYIINTTFVCNNTDYHDVAAWIKDTYIPAFMATRNFTGSRLAKVLENHDPETISLACELHCPSLSVAMTACNTLTPQLFEQLAAKYNQTVLHFTTVLKTI